MKILLATFFMVPHLGGVWKYMQQLKTKLELLGHEVDLLGYGEGNNFVHVVNENREIMKNKLNPLLHTILNRQSHPMIHEDPIINYYEFLRYFYELGGSYLGLDKYDLIHTQDVLSTACLNRIRPENTALLASLHGSVAHELKHHVNHVLKHSTSGLACTYIDKLEYEGATSAEYTIVANEWLKNILTSEFQVPADQLNVLHYGYETDQFLKLMKEESPIPHDAEKKVIIYTGRLAERKGVNYLLSALSQLKALRQDWVCWIVGDGPELETLQSQSKNLALDKDVRFLGKRDDVPYLLSNSDIFVFPSLLDNQPLSIIEAQIAGKPVIVSDAGGIPEMVEHGVTGILFPAGHTQMLCANLDHLLTDETYREFLGSNARKWSLNHWSLDNWVNNLLNIYQSAISKRKSAS